MPVLVGSVTFLRGVREHIGSLLREEHDRRRGRRTGGHSGGQSGGFRSGRNGRRRLWRAELGVLRCDRRQGTERTTTVVGVNA